MFITLLQRFKIAPLSTAKYALKSTLLTITLTITFIGALTAGHILTAPLLFTNGALGDTSLFRIALALFLAALAWGTPFAIWQFLTELSTPKPEYEHLPRYDTVAASAIIPAALYTLIMWTAPAWTFFAPGAITQSLSAFSTSGMENALTFFLVAIPMLSGFALLGRDTMHDRHGDEYTYTYPPKQRTKQTQTPTQANTNPSNSTNSSTPESTHNPSPSETTTQNDFSPEEDGYVTTERANTTRTNDSLDDYEYDWNAPPSLSFKDVGGMEELKEELDSEIIRPLTGDTNKYREFGVGIPNVLLHGPPGTGKTYIAKALAGELQYPYVKLSASEVTSQWINASGDRVSTLFKEAETLGKKYGYAVIFIDEIDAMLESRGNGKQHNEDKKVVNEFLNYLEGTHERNTLFIGATNHRDSLDSAATRPGRIDKDVEVGMPDLGARIEILRVQLEARPGRAPGTKELSRVATAMDGYSAADIESVVDSAARHAVERDGERVTLKDIRAAMNS